MPSPFESKKEFTIQKSVRVGKSCLLPMHKTFRSPLCICAAILLTTASNVSAVPDTDFFHSRVDISTSLSNTTDISVGSFADPIERYNRPLFGTPTIYGLGIMGSAIVDTTFSNTGDISLFYNLYGGAKLIGIESFDKPITNHGAITLNAKSIYYVDTDSPFPPPDGDIGAIGLVAYGNVTNTGTITVTAEAAAVYDSSSSLLRSSNATAIGINLGISNDSTVDSSGLIHVTASPAYDNLGGAIAGGSQRAYQIYSSTDNVTVTGFAMEFGGSQADLDTKYEGALGAASGCSISFSNDAKLYVYTNDQLQSGDNEYTIPALIEADSTAGNTKGYFAGYEIWATSPDYSVTSLSTRSDDQLQTISIKYDPQVSEPQFAASVRNLLTSHNTRNVKNTLVTQIFRDMLASDPKNISYQGALLASNVPKSDVSAVISDVPSKKGSVFLQPYYTNTTNDSSPMGYDADIYGLTGGYNYSVNGDLIFGFHAGIGNANIDYDGIGYDQRSDDIDVASAGIQSIYRFSDSWLFTAQSTFFYSKNDYDDHRVTNRESADYNSHGLKTSGDLGYLFTYGNHHFLPEIGLTHLWQHNEEYTTDNLDNANTTYGAIDDNEIYAHVGIGWFGYDEIEKWKIVPHCKIALEHTLTDGELSNTMTAGTGVQTTTYHNDKTAFTTDVSIEFSKDAYSLMAGHSGSYSSNITDNSIYLQFMIRF